MYYNGGNSILFVNATKLYKFKSKVSEIKPYPLSLGNISRYFLKKQDSMGKCIIFRLIIILLIIVILLVLVNV